MSSTIRRILIVRLSAIGDIVMSTSLLPGLRARYPDARITWLTTEVGVELLAHNPMIDEVRVLPLKQWSRDWKAGRWSATIRGIRKFVTALRAECHDLAIDPQGLFKSALWPWLAGVPERVGLRRKEMAHVLFTRPVVDAAGTGGQLCREYRLLAAELGLPMDVFSMVQALTEAERSTATERTSARNQGRPMVCLMPFTTRPQKHWFNDRWSEIATMLTRVAGAQVWILGGPADESGALEIAKASGVDVEVVAGPKSNLREKMALLDQAAVSIGVDTGLTHMSLGLGRPTVALFGSTCPYEILPEGLGSVLYEKLECSPCRRRPTCGGEFTCMRNLTVQRVLAAAQPYLGKA